MTNYFAVLGLEPTATDAEIKEAYRRLAKRYHPDAGGNDMNAMRRLNEAKEVLLDPVQRAQHRDVIGFYDRLTAAYVESRLRPDIPDSARKRRSSPPPWTKKQRRRFYLLAAFAIILLGAFFANYSRLFPNPKPLPPIAAILDRHPDSTSQTGDALIDTIHLSDLPLPGLLVEAQVLTHLGDDRGAVAYWAKALSLDSSNEQAAAGLAASYFREGRYAKGIQLLSAHVHTDSLLAKAYFDLGGLFLHSDLPFDAESAYQEVLIITERMRLRQENSPLAAMARAKLKEVE